MATRVVVTFEAVKGGTLMSVLQSGLRTPEIRDFSGRGVGRRSGPSLNAACANPELLSVPLCVHARCGIEWDDG